MFYFLVTQNLHGDKEDAVKMVGCCSKIEERHMMIHEYVMSLSLDAKLIKDKSEVDRAGLYFKRISAGKYIIYESVNVGWIQNKWRLKKIERLFLFKYDVDIAVNDNKLKHGSYADCVKDIKGGTKKKLKKVSFKLDSK